VVTKIYIEFGDSWLDQEILRQINKREYVRKPLLETAIFRIMHKWFARNQYALSMRKSKCRERVDRAIEIGIGKAMKRTGRTRDQVIRDALIFHFNIKIPADTTREIAPAVV
jgi:hypothetical protein